MTKQQLEKYANDCSVQAAKNLLLLVGPDNFDGDYDETMKELEYYYQQEMEDIDDYILSCAR